MSYKVEDLKMICESLLEKVKVDIDTLEPIINHLSNKHTTPNALLHHYVINPMLSICDNMIENQKELQKVLETCKDLTDKDVD